MAYPYSNIMTIKEQLLQELEQIPEPKLEALFNYLHILKKQSHSSPSQNLETLFNTLAQQWRTETRFISSTDQMVLHPAYQQIIGLGEAVIPLLLRELEQKPDHWFWALKSVSREDPVPPESRGRIQEMIAAWLNWGRSKGYTW